MRKHAQIGIDEIWKRFETYFQARGKTIQQMGFRPGIPGEFIKAAERKLKTRFPDDYRQFLRLCNGHDSNILNWLPDGMMLLELDDVVKIWESDMFFFDEDDMEKFFHKYSTNGKTRMIVYHPQRIPIIELEGEAAIYIDQVPGPTGIEGQVILSIDELEFMVIAESFKGFLARYVTLLEQGKLIFQRMEEDNREFFAIKTANGEYLSTSVFIRMIVKKGPGVRKKDRPLVEK